jgi:peptidoglycan/xylan/chitin deacetylase (PgdA/CDA1 family)
MIKRMFVFVFFFSVLIYSQTNEFFIRINQAGYLPNDIKVAVVFSKSDFNIKDFEIVDFYTNRTIYKSTHIKEYGEFWGYKKGYRLYFTDFEKIGKYYIKVSGNKSYPFTIGYDVYNGFADSLLYYIRQQRCGYNPFLKDSCHTHDGFIIYHGEKDSTHIDVTGGWHDASDYLQYLPTSATSVFHLLFAYYTNPNSFADRYDYNGNKTKNNIPDVLDEAKWGLDWMLKMNPNDGEYYNQIADDRDHAGYRLPTKDSISYGKGLERPVYFINGQIQGCFNNKNRTTGSASSVAKFASSFGLGALVFKDYYKNYSDLLKEKAQKAYDYAKAHEGYFQTAPAKSPYFYEEENWYDDMQHAAATLYLLTGKYNYYEDALNFAKLEKYPPWMGKDTANHYQWYPFVNIANNLISNFAKDGITKKLIESYIDEGLTKLVKRGEYNPFLIGVPFIWCSNNLVSSAITQFNLLNNPEYLEVETALRDWLFGCNPWGKCMVIGLPVEGDYPLDPHSALATNYGYKLTGGLVDGPVYGSIFGRLKGIKLYHGDEYEHLQPNYVVYHDDYGDYSSNEPTLDGTASLAYYFSYLQKKGEELKSNNGKFEINRGAIIRGDKNSKNIYLIFSAHEFADGGETIIKTLKDNNIKASFFFTGDFYRNSKFSDLIKNLIEDGHYLSGHSDKHLLYVDWGNRDSLIIPKTDLINDIENNYTAMKSFGINKAKNKYFLPPFEWHNEKVCKYAEELGVEIVNITPGTMINQDWTIPTNGKYYSSSELINKLYDFEKNDKNGLNGAILLMHFGTHPYRTDKLYNRLDEIIKYLKAKGYEFVTIDNLSK